MPPGKGGNTKKEAGRAKKEENENVKKSKAANEKEAAVAKDWEDGAKSNSKAEAAKAKAAEAERKKAEKAALLAAEEASLPSKPKPQVTGAAAKKKAVPTKKEKEKESIRPAGPGALAAGGGLASVEVVNKEEDQEEEGTVHLAATGLDNMLEALELVNAKTDKSSLGAKAGLIEKHPERRFKSAFEAYLEREMPILKKEHPGLRKQQMQDMLFKQFQKAPENPFNQVTAAYNSTKDDRVDALKASNTAKEQKYRVDG